MKRETKSALIRILSVMLATCLVAGAIIWMVKDWQNTEKQINLVRQIRQGCADLDEIIKPLAANQEAQKALLNEAKANLEKGNFTPDFLSKLKAEVERSRGLVEEKVAKFVESESKIKALSLESVELDALCDVVRIRISQYRRLSEDLALLIVASEMLKDIDGLAEEWHNVDQALTKVFGELFKLRVGDPIPAELLVRARQEVKRSDDFITKAEGKCGEIEKNAGTVGGASNKSELIEKAKVISQAIELLKDKLKLIKVRISSLPAESSQV